MGRSAKWLVCGAALMIAGAAGARNIVIPSAEITATKRQFLGLDVDTIRSVSIYKRAWTYGYVDEKGKDPIIFASLMEADCSEQRVRYLQSDFYDQNQNHVKKFSSPEWSYIVPESREATISRVVCSGSFNPGDSLGDVDVFQAAKRFRDLSE